MRAAFAPYLTPMHITDRQNLSAGSAAACISEKLRSAGPRPRWAVAPIAWLFLVAGACGSTTVPDNAPAASAVGSAADGPSCIRGDRLFGAKVGDTLRLGVPEPMSGRGVSDRLSVRLTPRSGILLALPGGASLLARAPGSTWVIRTVRSCVDSVQVVVSADSVVVIGAPVANTAAKYFVSPAGRADNDGSAARPWSLTHAFSAPLRIQPGDTVQLLTGRYSGLFRSRLTGTRARPIVIVGADSARPILDGGLIIEGSDAKYIDLEIMSSDPVRQTLVPGSAPAGLPRTNHSIEVNAPRINLLGLVIHDLGNALFAGILAEDLVIEGCVVYNNGWNGPDRSHGHGFYLQNRRPSKKRIAGNVLFHQFSTGIKISGTSIAWLENVDVLDNVTFDNGAPVSPQRGFSWNIFHQGGEQRSAALSFIRNVMVHSDDNTQGFKINAAAVAPGTDRLLFEDNLLQGRAAIGPWMGTVVRNNIFAMPFSAPIRGTPILEVWAPSISAPMVEAWSQNRYIVQASRAWPFGFQVGGRWTVLTFDEWRQQTGADRTGSIAVAPTPITVTRTIPLDSLPGRAVIVHWSISQSGSFTPDLSRVLRSGQRFAIRHVFSLNGPPVASGVYTGQPISLSAVSPPAPDPIGLPLDRSVRLRPPAVYLVTAR